MPRVQNVLIRKQFPWKQNRFRSVRIAWVYSYIEWIVVLLAVTENMILVPCLIFKAMQLNYCVMPSTLIEPIFLMKTFSVLLAFCVGNSPVTGEFTAERPVTRSFDAFFDLRLNKRLSKQSWGWWFEMLSCPLWRHCNVIFKAMKLTYCGMPSTVIKTILLAHSVASLLTLSITVLCLYAIGTLLSVDLSHFNSMAPGKCVSILKM